MSARRLLRSLAYHSGVLSLARLRQADTLTVLMLHRVLDRADPDFASADPAWTLSLSLFEQLLDFVVRHYDVVSLADVVSAHEGLRRLPQRAADHVRRLMGRQSALCSAGIAPQGAAGGGVCSPFRHLGA